MTFLSKQDKKYFLIIVLFSLINNFIVFPAQAAEEYNGVNVITKNVEVRVIKKPETKINRFEEIKANKKNKSKFINDFKIVEEEKTNTGSDFKINMIKDNKIETSNIPTKTVFLTAYTSEVAQTDNDPCTTANGFNLCDHGIEDSVAANFLPFGTKIMIPELFGDKVFVVRDRMNKRFSNRVDVWMLEKDNAIKFGVRQAKIIILEN